MILAWLSRFNRLTEIQLFKLIDNSSVCSIGKCVNKIPSWYDLTYRPIVRLHGILSYTCTCIDIDI